jgi:opacity protein-like surface antigen
MKALAVLLLATTSLAFAPAVFAADPPDLIVDDEPMVDNTYGWDGMYVGVGVGYEAWEPSPPAEDAITGSLIIGGNMSFDSFLIGVEGYATAIYYLDDDWGGRLGVTARGGALVGDMALIYAHGGVYYDFDFDWHGTVGLGAEFMVSDNMSIDVRYTYADDLDSDFSSHGIGVSAKWHF